MRVKECCQVLFLFHTKTIWTRCASGERMLKFVELRTCCSAIKIQKQETSNTKNNRKTHSNLTWREIHQTNSFWWIGFFDNFSHLIHNNKKRNRCWKLKIEDCQLKCDSVGITICEFICGVEPHQMSFLKKEKKIPLYVDVFLVTKIQNYNKTSSSSKQRNQFWFESKTKRFRRWACGCPKGCAKKQVIEWVPKCVNSNPRKWQMKTKWFVAEVLIFIIDLLMCSDCSTFSNKQTMLEKTQLPDWLFCCHFFVLVSLECWLALACWYFNFVQLDDFDNNLFNVYHFWKSTFRLNNTSKQTNK